MLFPTFMSTAQQAPTEGNPKSQPGSNTQPEKPASSQTKPATAAKTTPLPAVATVNASITVEAGLLTHDSAKQLFSGWVADHFAVVQVTIGNHSRDQQFILQDVFFDYSRWALSGLYTSGVPIKPQTSFQDYQQGTKPGEISSIGALEVHDGLKSWSVFSPRNTLVNGLVLVGTTAGGFAFLGPTGFTQGVTGYNSAFIPGLQRFWPDRTIDQQTNVLKYGFQDKIVIAKEDPGKTYAFFPIDRFLSGGLADLYREDPAIFFNPAELFLDPNLPIIEPKPKSGDATLAPAAADSSGSSGHCGKHIWRQSDCKQLISMKRRLLALIRSVPSNASLTEADILLDLTSPCQLSDLARKSPPGKASQNKPANEGQPPTSNDEKSATESADVDQKVNATGSGSQTPEDTCPYAGDPKKLTEIQGLKNLMSGASLNSVHIVVSGIMTVDVETIPAIIAGLSFDNESKGESFWSDLKDKQTGVISGRYLTNGKPVITAIKLPASGVQKAGASQQTSTATSTTPVAKQPPKATSKTKTPVSSTTAGSNTTSSTASDGEAKPGADNTTSTSDTTSTPQVSGYISSLVAVQDGSTDSELHFSLQFKRQIPPGSTLTFQVVKTSSKSVNNGTNGANTSETTSSMNYDYSVDYKATTPAPAPAATAPAAAGTAPSITTLTFKGETPATWGAAGNAIAGTISGTGLTDGTVEIKQITIPGESSSEVKDYVKPKDINSGTSGSNATTLNFTLTLSKAIPSGAELLFAVETKDENGKESISKLKPHSIPKTAAKKVTKPKATHP
jgi:hypothetical protein